MRALRPFLLILAASCYAFGQTYTIATLAGGGLPVNVAGLSAGLGRVGGVAVDSHGNVFIAAPDYNIVLRLDGVSGLLTLAAGNGTAGFSGDNGPAASAQLSGPSNVAVDSAGSLYIGDSGNMRIRKVMNGAIATVAGGGTGCAQQTDFIGDGCPATSAILSGPNGVAVDASGNLYIADTAMRTIREVSGGVIATVAGGGAGCAQQTDSLGDGCPATSASLASAYGVNLDTAGNLYITQADYATALGAGRVRMVSGGVITTVAGGGSGCTQQTDSVGDGCPATSALLNGSGTVAADSAGNLYIADELGGRVRMVAGGVITTLAGTGTPGFSGDNGPAARAQVSPAFLATDTAGGVYIAEPWNQRIRKISGGTITTIAGNGTGASGDGGPALGAQLDNPSGVALDAAGDVFIADTTGSRIRQVSNGVIGTVALLSNPWGVASDAIGDIFVAEAYQVVESTQGVLTVVAGTDVPGAQGDGGAATKAQLNQPYAVAVDSVGALYIADSRNNRIRKVANGIITTVAGGGLGSTLGDGGPATSGRLSYPTGVAVDASGNLFIADTDDNLIREVAHGIITTVAGIGGSPGFRGDGGMATQAMLNYPWGIAVDSAGSVYFADSSNQRIRKISGGMITTIAGGGTTLADGVPAIAAQLAYPAGVAVDAAGNVYVADSLNDRVRVLTPAGTPCTYSVDPASFSDVAYAGGKLVVNVQTAAGCGWAVQSLPVWFSSATPVNSGPGSATLTIAPNPGAARSSTGSVAGIAVPVTQSAAPLSIAVGGVVNDASYTAPVVPGSIAAAFGEFTLTAPAVDTAWPTIISGLSLKFGGGTLAPLYFASGGQVNLQVPWELAGQSQATVTTLLNGQTGAAQTVSLAPYAPAIFAINGQGTGQGAILDAQTYVLVDASHPATAGSTYLSIYCTGLGAVTNRPATGEPAPASPLSWTTTVPTVTVGGAAANVSFYGLAPGFVGLYQVNAQVPAASAKGSNVPVSIAFPNATSNTVTIAVQ